MRELNNDELEQVGGAFGLPKLPGSKWFRKGAKRIGGALVAGSNGFVGGVGRYIGGGGGRSGGGSGGGADAAP